MITLAVLNTLYEELFHHINDDKEIKKNVTQVYKLLPKKYSYPYIIIYLNNYSNTHTNWTSILRVTFSCEIVTHDSDDTLKIIQFIRAVFAQFEYFVDGLQFKKVDENQTNLKQIDNLVTSTLNFYFLIKEGN